MGAVTAMELVLSSFDEVVVSVFDVVRHIIFYELKKKNA
jgi:hypothetical protein